jgi:FkbM family methyltransferase
MQIKTKRKGKCSNLKKIFIVISCLSGVVVCILLFKQNVRNVLTSPTTDTDTDTNTADTADKNHPSVGVQFQRPPDCTLDQLKTVRRQLRPDTCVSAIQDPFLQRCSLTQHTKCPDASNYLDEYYDELQQEYLKGIQNNDNDGMEPFVGLSVGCNKGFDALNTLRRGTFDASLSKDDWRMEMTKDGILHESVCVQNITLPFQVSPNIQQPRKGIVHCFEPVPSTVQKLQSASTHLGYDQKGYKVIHAAVSNTPGKEYFQSKARPGHENGGLDNCRNDVGNVECDVEVEVLTLENYAKEHLVGNGPIHILQIDVEGYDADVLLGAGNEFLERVEYLEFEYNWMGSWKKQHLYNVIEMLDTIGFTCYWAGKQKLWRVTGCWQLYFDVHTWSNLACANRKRVPKLATKMESIFQEQLIMDKKMASGAATRLIGPIRHEITSLNPTMMTSKYLTPEAIERAMVRKRMAEVKKKNAKQKKG